MAHGYGMVGRRIPTIMVRVSVGTAKMDHRRGMVSQTPVSVTESANAKARLA